MMSERRTFKVGVSSPASIVKSRSRITNSRIDSARDTEVFAWSIAGWISARSSGEHEYLVDRDLGETLVRRPVRQDRRVDRDERGDEGPGVADDHGLADQLVRTEVVLERCRGDVLSGGSDDQLLLAARDPQIPLVVEFADVAGAEPPVVVEHLGGGVLVVPVAGEDLGTLGEDLAVARRS